MTLPNTLLGFAPSSSRFYNLGNSGGYSVSQVISRCEKIPAREKPRRSGFFTLAQVPAPTLDIQRASTNTFLLSWPSSFTGFAFQENTNLVAAN